MKKNKIIVLGIGNSILGDDGIGLKVVNDLSKLVREPVDFIQTEEMGFGLLDFMIDYEQAVIIDSIQAGGVPGTIHLFSIDDFNPNSTVSNHYVGLPELGAMSAQMGLNFPEKVNIIGIEINDPYKITDQFSEEIHEKYESILNKVNEELVKLCDFKKDKLRIRRCRRPNPRFSEAITRI